MTRTTRMTRTIAALLLAAAALAGCSAPAEKPAEKPAESEKAAFPVTVTDDADRSVTVDAAPERIVSLAPGNTEILFALGLGDKVVGVTSYDDYPAEVKDIEKVGDFAGPNMEAVAAADPDLVLATSGVQADVIAKLEELGATVLAIDPTSLDGLYEDIEEIGAVTGTATEAEALVADMRADGKEIAEIVADREPVKVFVEIGQNPLFTVGEGTLIDELLTAAGGDNVVTSNGYVPYSAEELVKADPAVYMATHSSASDIASIGKRAGYAELQAVKSGRVVILDDNLTSRPGPRIMEGLRLIAEGLHPDAFEAE